MELEDIGNLVFTIIAGAVCLAVVWAVIWFGGPKVNVAHWLVIAAMIWTAIGEVIGGYACYVYCSDISTSSGGGVIGAAVLMTAWLMGPFAWAWQVGLNSNPTPRSMEVVVRDTS